jgi:hypothetical protein
MKTYIKPDGREIQVNEASESIAKEMGWKKKKGTAKKKAKKKG